MRIVTICMTVGAMLAVGACADRVADRAAKDTLPPQALSGRGEVVAVAKCVYDRVLTRDCQGVSQRLLLIKDPGSGDIVVMCDENLGYGGIRPGFVGGAATPGAAMVGIVAQVVAVNDQVRESRDPTHFPAYQLSLRSKADGVLEATAWALNEPDKGPGRRDMMAEAFGACVVP